MTITKISGERILLAFSAANIHVSMYEIDAYEKPRGPVMSFTNHPVLNVLDESERDRIERIETEFLTSLTNMAKQIGDDLVLEWRVWPEVDIYRGFAFSRLSITKRVRTQDAIKEAANGNTDPAAFSMAADTEPAKLN